MTRKSSDEYRHGYLYNGYDYENQVWVVKGRYVRCGHPDTMNCGCYGREHEGKYVDPTRRKKMEIYKTPRQTKCPECHTVQDTDLDTHTDNHEYLFYCNQCGWSGMMAKDHWQEY